MYLVIPTAISRGFGRMNDARGSEGVGYVVWPTGTCSTATHAADSMGGTWGRHNSGHLMGIQLLPAATTEVGPRSARPLAGLSLRGPTRRPPGRCRRRGPVYQPSEPEDL